MAALKYLGADYGVCGEGEGVFPALLERLQRGLDAVGLPGAYALGGPVPTTRIFAEELVAAMAEAGCAEVSLGFESGCPKVLEAMNKHFGPAEVREISAEDDLLMPRFYIRPGLEDCIRRAQGVTV